MLERGGERAGGGERVGAGEGGIGDEHARQRSTSRSIAQAIASRSTSSADGGPSVTNVTEWSPRERLRQLHRLGHRAPAVGVHLEVEALAHEPTVGAELHLLERRDLLDEGRNAHDCYASSSATSRRSAAS